MDEIEFKERLFADPFTADQDIIKAAANNPNLAQLRLEVQDFDRHVKAAVQTASASSALLQKLLAIPASDAATINIGQATETQKNGENVETGKNVKRIGSNGSNGSIKDIGTRNSVAAESRRPLFQYFALAASLVVAVGLTYSMLGNSSAPSAAEIAFGEEVLNHLHLDTDAVNALNSPAQLQIQMVNKVLDHAGVQLVSTDSLQANVIKFAEPCVIIPSNQSAHLVIQGNQGVINVIVINNSPVASEFRINNDRQAGRVIPMSDGNLVLVSDSEAALDQFSKLFSEGLQWSI